ncbi:MAG: redoxin domain-containing protein [Mucilaginibacter sp.]
MKNSSKYIKLPVVILLLAVTGFLSAFQNTGRYLIKGHIEGMTFGEVSLTYPSATGEVVDSVKVTNGNFVFKGSLKEPLMMALKIAGSKTQLYFFGENADIRITAKKDSLYKGIVTGSTIQNEWKSYLKDYSVITAYAGTYYHKVDSVNKLFKSKPDSAAKQFLKGENAKLLALDLKMHEKFFGANSHSVVCAYVINTHFTPYFQFDQARELFALLAPDVKKSYYGKQVQESLEIEKRSGIGAKPNFTMTDINGRPVSLTSFRGKYVLVDFWASWCAPCRRENPNVLANYKKYHEMGFEVLGVSLDSKKEPWLKAIQMDGLPWTHVSDLKGWQNAAAVEFGVKVVPTNFLLDKDGKVIAKNIREEGLGKELKSIFNK